MDNFVYTAIPGKKNNSPKKFKIEERKGKARGKKGK